MTEKRRAMRKASPKAYREALLKRARKVKVEKKALNEAFGFQLKPRQRRS